MGGPKGAAPERKRPKARRHRQTELVFRTWGGAREGSGRKPRPENIGLLPHIARPAFDKNVPVHVTMRALPGTPDLRTERATRLVRHAFSRASEKGFRVLHFSIQSNHIHLLAEADDGPALARGMQRLASRIALLVNPLNGRRGRFWRERYHRRDLTSPRQYRRALVYALFNARKHATGHERERRRRVLDGGCTSVFWVDAWDAPPELVARIIAVRAGPSPVARPRTFIASRGWQRHGRLRPDEQPAAPG